MEYIKYEKMGYYLHRILVKNITFQRCILKYVHNNEESFKVKVKVRKTNLYMVKLTWAAFAAPL